ncbi:hypothetical protein VKT23_011021 [Stygiomarasmius scandens]|uniref:Reverse transcriptase zinc-binding domain-containing protein n=1 Tax=Marasmiellus scandens TaxID=2682957 RepID=A0ABR1JDR9_9AGAR
MALEKEKASPIHLVIPPTLQITGAKLSTMTQALAYKAIIQQKTTKDDMRRRRTTLNVMRVKESIKTKFGYIPTEAALWKSIRHKDFSRKTRYFLWMTTHDAYMTGTHWTRPNLKPELQERALCAHCDEIEDLEHILTSCRSPGQITIWNLTAELWERKRTDTAWDHPTLGDILGCGLAMIKSPEKKENRLAGETRMWRILLGESAYLIWKLRCERVIANDNQPFSEREVKNRWIAMLNERLELDCRMSNKKYETKAIPKRLVQKTWRGLLFDEQNLPDDWTSTTGVLVGIESDRRRRTGTRER